MYKVFKERTNEYVYIKREKYPLFFYNTSLSLMVATSRLLDDESELSKIIVTNVTIIFQ